MTADLPRLWPEQDPDGVMLHRAATLIRTRAAAANTDDERRPYGNDRVDPVPEHKWGHLVDNYLGGAIGTHCAAWTPTAATAVADQLDLAADKYWCGTRAPLVAIARAYLNEPEDTTVPNMTPDPTPGLPAAVTATGLPPGLAVADSLRHTILADIAAERQNQIGRWGDQSDLPDADPAILSRLVYATPDAVAHRLAECYRVPSANVARTHCVTEVAEHGGTWAGIIVEEIAEWLGEITYAHSTGNTTNLREGAVQAAACLVAYIEALDGRGLKATPQRPTTQG